MDDDKSDVKITERMLLLLGDTAIEAELSQAVSELVDRFTPPKSVFSSTGGELTAGERLLFSSHESHIRALIRRAAHG